MDDASPPQIHEVELQLFPSQQHALRLLSQALAYVARPIWFLGSAGSGRSSLLRLLLRSPDLENLDRVLLHPPPTIRPEDWPLLLSEHLKTQHTIPLDFSLEEQLQALLSDTLRPFVLIIDDADRLPEGTIQSLWHAWEKLEDTPSRLLLCIEKAYESWIPQGHEHSIITLASVSRQECFHRLLSELRNRGLEEEEALSLAFEMAQKIWKHCSENPIEGLNKVLKNDASFSLPRTPVFLWHRRDLLWPLLAALCLVIAWWMPNPKRTATVSSPLPPKKTIPEAVKAIPQRNMVRLAPLPEQNDAASLPRWDADASVSGLDGSEMSPRPPSSVIFSSRVALSHIPRLESKASLYTGGFSLPKISKLSFDSGVSLTSLPAPPPLHDLMRQPSHHFSLQLAADKNPASLRRQSQKLPNPHWIFYGKGWWRLVYGNFKTREEARKMLKKLARKEAGWIRSFSEVQKDFEYDE